MVIFPDGDSWVNETAIEIVDSAARNVVELLKNKQFGRVTDLRRNLTNIQLSGRLANIVYSWIQLTLSFMHISINLFCLF